MFSGNASCNEIPDAIGWNSQGSIVVECKVSLSDFRADARKVTLFRHKVHGYTVRRCHVEKMGEFEIVTRPLMGDERFFMVPYGLIGPEMVERVRPDHGLLWVKGRRVLAVREATRRPSVAKDSEIRYLRFAIINGKDQRPRAWWDRPEQPIQPATGGAA